ncbi:hypothetical protein AtEden1_Chr5g0085811 [Arabidopsis thaliana]
MDDNNIPSSFRSVQSTFSNHSFVSKVLPTFFHLIPSYSYQTIDSSLNGYKTVVRLICFRSRTVACSCTNSVFVIMSLSDVLHVIKAKHLLLQKLCRFEQLAGLDPMELEKRMSDQETEEEEEEEEEEMKSLYHCEIITQRVLKTYFEEMVEVPEGVEALISDLAAEELPSDIDGEAEAAIVAKRVCERLRSWRDVESNTIDMMVEHDFRTERLGLWRSKNDADVSETVLDIEFEIFEDLVEELSEDIGGNR